MLPCFLACPEATQLQFMEIIILRNKFFEALKTSTELGSKTLEKDEKQEQQKM